MRQPVGWFVVAALLLAGCQGEDGPKDKKSSGPAYRLVSQTHESADSDLYLWLYRATDANISYAYDGTGRLASMEVSHDRLDSPRYYWFSYQSDDRSRLLEQKIYLKEDNGTGLLVDHTVVTYGEKRERNVVGKSDWDADGAFDKIETRLFTKAGVLETLFIDWDWGVHLYMSDETPGVYRYVLPSFSGDTDIGADADGEVDFNISYEYNEAHQVTKRIEDFFDNGIDMNVTYMYNPSGQLTEIHTSFDDTYFTYDENGRVVRQRHIWDIEDNFGDIYTYTYTSEGALGSKEQLEYAVSDDENETWTYRTTYSYDDQGRMTRMESDFETLSYQYDFAYDVQELRQQIQKKYDIDYALYELGYDENGNLTQVIYYDNTNGIPTRVSRYEWEKTK